MTDAHSQITQELAQMASSSQRQRTGLAPKAVTVSFCEDTLTLTLHEALTPAEQVLVRTPQGAAQVQEFHRQLFSSDSESMRKAIKRITGREVRETTAEIETTMGAVVHAFTTGAMVQVFLLTPTNAAYTGTDRVSLESADEDGRHPADERQSSE
ncbi:DUF2294 domain-containing protein [Aeoliella sp. ICT_H6.2]|uniref:DUF2294 domain-containing protein n=1 Tax=Aeoliella straminimaris TaxID=2954799 RepID=A0A9X2FH28_9BACT|nr:Na-translocating system protein MpsC family protein [Aeoliella straminimaris]MCO6044371.1 DUF2294 domain-containing protein [Aeoliella straminimaris]